MFSGRNWSEILDASRNPTSPSSARFSAQRAQHSIKMVPRWSQKPPKSSQDGPRGPKMEPKWRQDGVRMAKNQKKHQRNNKMGPLNSCPAILAEKVANMAPTWIPKWSQDGQKIDAKIDQKFDASWDRFLGGFWWILEGKMEPSWHQNRSKIDANGECDFLKNRALAAAGARFLRFWESKLGVKIDKKSMKKRSPRWMPSWLRFFLDFD